LEQTKRYSIKKILLTTLWVVLGAASVLLLAAAIRKKDTSRCKGVEITIKGADANVFVDEADIMQGIRQVESGDPVGKPVGAFNLKMMEAQLEKNIWIKSAELFFDNNEVLRVNVQEREPVARVFTATGNSFYIDQELTMLPLSDKFSARLPVFTGFPSDARVLAPADSSLLAEIRDVSLAIQQDTFCMALIDQVDITDRREFDMLPKVGNQLIRFGTGTDAEEKLNKLKLFYKEIMATTGLAEYSVISLQYKNQVVAKKRGAEDIAADAQRTMLMMQALAERAKQQANDSLQMIQQDNERNTVDSSMIQQSIEREESAQPSNTYEKPKPQEEGATPAVTQTVAAPAASVPAKQPAKPGPKPAKPETGKPKPKAVMKKPNTPIP
jgi:cell division protein FtsQ